MDDAFSVEIQLQYHHAMLMDTSRSYCDTPRRYNRRDLSHTRLDVILSTLFTLSFHEQETRSCF
jgi:hypothetical protein